MRGYKTFTSNPRPGDLRERITIGVRDNIINENGFPEAQDRVICTVWASVMDAGNQNFRAADTMNSETVLNFTIRYRADIQPGMWIEFRGMRWIINTLGEYEFKRRYLGLKASISKGVDG